MRSALVASSELSPVSLVAKSPMPPRGDRVTFPQKNMHTSTNTVCIYIYIYIYLSLSMCGCVCVYFCLSLSLSLSLFYLELSLQCLLSFTPKVSHPVADIIHVEFSLEFMCAVHSRLLT